MHIVDAHIHLWTRVPAWRGCAETPSPAYGQVVVEGQSRPMLPPSFVDSTSTAELAIAHMDRCGIARAVIVQETMDGFLDEVVGDAVRRYPDRFIGEALPDPRRGPASAEDLDRTLRDTPLRGIKIPLGGFQRLAAGFDLDGEIASAWFEVCSAHGGFVTIHPGPPDGFAGPLRTAAERFGGVAFIIAHLGLPDRPRWESVLEVAKLPNVYLELAAVPYLFKERYPCPRAAHVIEKAAATVGVEKLLWGSDYPRTLTDLTYQQQIEVVSLGCRNLSESDRERILGLNVERLLGADP